MARYGNYDTARLKDQESTRTVRLAVTVTVTASTTSQEAARALNSIAASAWTRCTPFVRAHESEGCEP
jgi:hypothetical protein